MAEDSGNEDSWLYGDSNQEASELSAQNEPKESKNEEEPMETEPQATTVKEISVDKVHQVPPPPANIIDAGASTATLDTNGTEPVQTSEENGEVVENGAEGSGAKAGEEDEEDDDDDDDSEDDDVQVTIGDIKPASSYAAINLKRGLAVDKTKNFRQRLAVESLLTDKDSQTLSKALKKAIPASLHRQETSALQPGKFSIEEFEAVGTINNVPAHEFNLDNLEDKPWRKPGADITDYFNYGFNEDTWRAYCERQKRIRVQDSGVGLGTLGGVTKVVGPPGSIPVTITNDNSKYSGLMLGGKKAGPPPGRKFAGAIDVIGVNASRRSVDGAEVHESPIQVMTADRREYGRTNKPGFPDLSVPPPTLPPFDMPPPNIDTIPSFTGAGFNSNEFYGAEPDPYYQNYEPTQDSQWGTQRRSSSVRRPYLGQNSRKRSLPWEGGGPVSAVTNVVIPLGGDASRKSKEVREVKEKDGCKSREGRESSAGGEKEEEKERSERHSRHRHRSRSKSTERSSRSSKKRNKSKSRSPSHRHRSKKKSRRSERDESE